MKKVLIGCGIATLVIILVLGFIGYNIYRITKDIGGKISEVGDHFESLEEKYPFTETENGLVRSDRFRIWIETREGLSENTESLINIFEDFSIKNLGKLKDQSFEYIYTFADILEQNMMSPREYIWISRQVVGVLHSGDARANPEMQDILKAFDDLDDEERAHSNQNIHTLGVPVTHTQIVHLSRLLINYNTQVLTTMKVFYADVAVFALTGGFHNDEDNDENVEFAPVKEERNQT